MLIALTLASLLTSVDLDNRDPGALTVLAEIALERGDCRTAAETYAAAVPAGSAALAQRASEVGLACEHLPSGWDAVQRWRALAPQDANAAAVYAAIALKLYRIAETQAAVRTFIEGEESDTKLAKLVAILLDEAESHAVLAAVSGVVDTQTASPATLTVLAELAFDAHDLGRAEQYLRPALKQDSSLFEAHSLMAQIHAAQGDEVNAVAAARAAMQADEQRGAFELAATLVALDRLDEAKQEFARLRAEGAATEEIDRRLALLAYESGDIEEARRRLTELVAQGAGRAPARTVEAAVSAAGVETAQFYLAELEARAGDVEGALAGYRRLLNSSIAMTARTRAAALLLKRGQRAEALTMLDDYVNEHPESAFELTRTKANLLSTHGENDSALALVGAALERYPQHPALEYDRAVLLEREGKVKDSIAVLRRLLEKRPGDPSLLNALGYTLAEHGMKLAQAEGLIRRALAVTPDNPAVMDSLGWVRYKRGDAGGAAALLERAYALGKDSEIAAHWGEALWKSGAMPQARKVWAAALERDPDSFELQAVIARFVPLAKP